MDTKRTRDLRTEFAAHLDHLYTQRSRGMRFSGASRADFDAWQTQAHAELTASVRGEPAGLLPLELERIPLSAPAEDGFAGVRVERLYYRTREDLTATAYLVLPQEPTAPAPAVLCPPGHGDGMNQVLFERPGIYHQYPVELARRGLVALVPEHVGFGERAGASYHRAYTHGYYYLAPLLLGENAMGYLVWDMRRALDVLNAKNRRKRTKAYRDLLKVTWETVGYAEAMVTQLEACGGIMADLAAAEITRYVGLVERVIDQTERRVLHGEVVPASEKIVSLFEPHTDIIVKDRRDTHYGHKLTLTAGSSGLILDWVVEDGNPADSTLVTRTIERQKEIYGRVPRQIAFDGGYASQDNLKAAKKLGIRDVAFSKKRGLEVLDMARSHWVYRRLRNFRAGVEAWISFLKRCFGLDRCSWHGADGFARYVGASVVAANLLTLARHLA